MAPTPMAMAIADAFAATPMIMTSIPTATPRPVALVAPRMTVWGSLCMLAMVRRADELAPSGTASRLRLAVWPARVGVLVTQLDCCRHSSGAISGFSRVATIVANVDRPRLCCWVTAVRALSHFPLSRKSAAAICRSEFHRRGTTGLATGELSGATACLAISVVLVNV